MCGKIERIDPCDGSEFEKAFRTAKMKFAKFYDLGTDTVSLWRVGESPLRILGWAFGDVVEQLH